MPSCFTGHIFFSKFCLPCLSRGLPATKVGTFKPKAIYKCLRPSAFGTGPGLLLSSCIYCTISKLFFPSHIEVSQLYSFYFPIFLCFKMLFYLSALYNNMNTYLLLLLHHSWDILTRVNRICNCCKSDCNCSISQKWYSLLP